ncbi:MAG TPA: twin-arginine translocase subunit TatC [Candidatus Acidoferrum sp.]|nr:twin-arginine translocase subunit TatC [Candidatus Acidoferrum sp.]
MAKKSESEEDPNEAKKMPLLDHLIELRQRLFYGAIFVVIAFFGCWFVSNDILLFLMQPLDAAWFAKFHQHLQQFIYTSLTEPFFVRVKLSFFGAMVLAFPFVAAQIWAFVAPGLYKHEKAAFLPFLVATPILFAMGAALLYYVLVPYAWQFFISFQFPETPDHPALELLPKVGEYVSLMMQLVFAFGLCFQMPVLLTLLTRVGIIGSDTLKQKRRYAIVVVFVVAAIFTPPDPISMMSLAVPLVALYEISVWLSVWVERDRERRMRESEKEDEDGNDDAKRSEGTAVTPAQ